MRHVRRRRVRGAKPRRGCRAQFGVDGTGCAGRTGVGRTGVDRTGIDRTGVDGTGADRTETMSMLVSRSWLTIASGGDGRARRANGRRDVALRTRETVALAVLHQRHAEKMPAYVHEVVERALRRRDELLLHRDVEERDLRLGVNKLPVGKVATEGRHGWRRIWRPSVNIRHAKCHVSGMRDDMPNRRSAGLRERVRKKLRLPGSRMTSAEVAAMLSRRSAGLRERESAGVAAASMRRRGHGVKPRQERGGMESLSRSGKKSS